MKSGLYIPSLTGIRAIAAFLVFFHHFNQADFPYPVFRMLNEMHVGVTIFFVLSGFLICFRYYQTVQINASWFKNYIKNRIARIYPMYLLLTVATFLYATLTANHAIYNGVENKWLVFGMNVFFLRGFFDELKFTGVSQGWSLTVEECFYLLAPFFFVLIQKSKSWFYKLPILLLAAGSLLVLIFGKHAWWGFYGNFTFMFLFTFTGRCCEFFAGMYLATLLLEGKYTTSKKLLATLLGSLGLLGCIILLALQPLDDKHAFGLYQPAGIAINNLLLPIAVAVLFFGLITEKTWLSKWLATPFMQVLGKSSYIFYLLHIGFVATESYDLINMLFENWSTWLDEHEMYGLAAFCSSRLLSIGVVFILLNFISFLLWHFIEEPMNHLIRKSNFLVAAKQRN